MSIATQSIRAILSSQPSAAAVFDRFEIDLCVHAEESLAEACAGLHLSTDQVMEKLAEAGSPNLQAHPVSLEAYPPSRLIQHIVRTHHRYVRQELPRLVTMAEKLVARHGERRPEMRQISTLLCELCAEMLAHLEKEEAVLFPFVAQMEEEFDWSAPSACACFRTIAQPIARMTEEHGAAEALVARLREMTHGFEASKSACLTEVALHDGMRRFADDLRQHVHLEDDILFPRAIKMETELQTRR